MGLLHLVGMFLLMVLIFIFACWTDDFDDYYCDDSGTLSLPAVVGLSVGLHVISYFTAGWTMIRWRTKMLEGSHQILRLAPDYHDNSSGGCYSQLATRLETDIPTAEILTIIDGDGEDDPEAPAVVAQATAIPTHEQHVVTTKTTAGLPAAPVLAAVVAQDSDQGAGLLAWYDPQEKGELSTQIREAIKTEDWVFLRGTFARLRGNQIDRSFYIDIINSTLEENWENNRDIFCHMLDTWARNEPNNPDCSLIRGSCYILWAWDAHGSGYSDTVDANAWPTFHARIDQAKEELLHTSKLDPSDALAHFHCTKGQRRSWNAQ